MRILSFSGLIPEQICDTVRFTGYPGEGKIPHYCGYAADYIEQVRNDPAVDGAVFPRSCDSCRVMGSYLEGSGKFVYRFHVPARRDGSAEEMLSGTVRDYKNAVERHYGTAIPEAEIRERILLVNERNRALAGLYAELEEQDISYASYLEMLHALLREPLREQRVGNRAGPGNTAGKGNVPEPGNGTGPGSAMKSGNGIRAGSAAEPGDFMEPGNAARPGNAGTPRKRVFLVGSLLCDTGLVRTMEGAGLKIVGDNLTESKRLFSAPPVNPEGDPYRNIARSMMRNRLSPTQDDFTEILAEDREEIRRKNVQGVLFVTQKYCEPYDYLFYVYRQMLQEMGIPCLKLARAGSADGRRPEAAIEAFADSL